MATDTTQPDVEPDAGNDDHPSSSQYIEIAVILAVMTALEIGLYYAGLPTGLTIGLLVGLTIGKFVLVALWFMHLRFDRKILSFLFYAGLLLAVVLYIALIAIIFLGH